jgi:transcriptional regulator with XRE-family HTH domain
MKGGWNIMENEMSLKIKKLRLERGMTLEQVADIVGVGKSTVRKWETGMIANMRRDKIALLAHALGTTPAYLMGWKEDEEMTISPIEQELTEGEKLLLELFRQIPEDAQKMYLEVLRASLKKQS